MTTKTGEFELLGKFRDEDGTEKCVFQSAGGIIELTSIKNKPGIDVICLPTHHYCNLGCKFCHLTEEGDSSKPMDTIAAQDLAAALAAMVSGSTNKKGLLSFMGVGEPFLCPELIVDTYKAVCDKYEVLSIALSTMMPIVDPVEFFIAQASEHDLPLKLHFSLHSTHDTVRNDIIPASRVSIEECFWAMDAYRRAVLGNDEIQGNLRQFHSDDTAVEIHYSVIDGINDSDHELELLINYGRLYKIPLKILKFNPTKSLKNSPREEHWFRMLSEHYGAPVAYYAPPGPNIGSSCGQFTKHFYLGSGSAEELREFEAWKKKYQVFD